MDHWSRPGRWSGRTGTAASTTAAAGTIYVGQAVANTAYKCVVTFAVNGTTVATNAK